MILPLLGLLVANPISFPPGSSPEFQEAVRMISEALGKGDKEKAERLLALLPSKTNTYAWDDSGVPADQRADFAKARDKVLSEWRQSSSNPGFLRGSNASLVFRFAPVLAPGPEDGIPLGVALFFNPKATPRMEAVIGLQRGKDHRPVTTADVEAAIRFSVARYLGLAEKPSGPMKPPGMAGLGSTEFVTVDANLRLFESLQKAVKENKPVAAGTPQVKLDPLTIDIGTVTQGDQVPFTVQISNTGTAPLSYRNQGDCGCVVGSPPGTIEPGGVTLMRPHVDTTEYIGKLTKALIVNTNDPNTPTVTIPVKLMVKPVYRFLAPQGDTILLDDTKKISLFLSFAEGHAMNIRQIMFSGMPVKVTQTDWEGELPDPTLNEPSTKRKGYRFDLEINGETQFGRAEGTLLVITDNPKFHDLRTMVYAQTGIVALPEDVYLGALGSDSKQMDITLSRPGKSFKILSIASNNPHIKATSERVQPGVFKIHVSYDGKVSSGQLEAQLTVKTDDAKQPSMIVSVRGFVP